MTLVGIAAVQSTAIAEEEDSPEDRIAELEDKLAALEQRLADAEAQGRRARAVRISGYVDFGFFYPRRDGVGWVQDVGNTAVPELAGRYGWVFLGDVLAPAVNSRGEPADLGDPPGTARFDSVDSGGAPGFLLNEVNLRLDALLGFGLSLAASVDFVPRSGTEFALGDFVDVDLVQLEWVVAGAQWLSVFMGKIEPVFGISAGPLIAARRSLP